MRHLKSGRKLNRSPSHRWALMRNLVTSLLRDERIQTTDPKAKELRRWAERVISLGKQGSLYARRRVLGIICDKGVVRKLFDTLAPRFKDRPGGYTRIVKIGWRHGDHAPISLVELMPATEPKTPAADKGGRRTRRRTATAKEEAAKRPRAPRQTGKAPTA